MKRLSVRTIILSSLLFAPVALERYCLANGGLEGFVDIQGGTFRRGRGASQGGAEARAAGFEILDHPVTNGEYKAFVDATGHRCPLHWTDGVIPQGKADHPVISVNRADVLAYLDWLSKKMGRVCRLPTAAKFEYVSRGGQTGKAYPWGDEEPSARANYDANGDRDYRAWLDYLEPARFGAVNGFGLYGMSGNVWQMVNERHDPATTRFKYRIDDPLVNENSMIGGSWARSDDYLKCGYRLGISAGIRHSDLGFRPVREPRTADWTEQTRKLIGVSQGDGRVLLSWASLNGDKADTQFHVYRATSRNHAGLRVTKIPVATSTAFVDGGCRVGTRYQYYVRPVDAAGEEGRRSEWCGVSVRREP